MHASYITYMNVYIEFDNRITSPQSEKKVVIDNTHGCINETTQPFFHPWAKAKIKDYYICSKPMGGH